ncbi:MAG TPA: hypothetical protein VD997_13190 [Phycisphaerales bacterium]|nr:hypothetical protein [Phycisphaerales bacterium]
MASLPPQALVPHLPHGVSQSYSNRLARSNVDIGRVIFDLKNEAVEVVLAVARKVATDAGLTLRAMGRPFPQSMAEVLSSTRSGVNLRLEDAEWVWVMAQAVVFSDKVGRFVTLKAEFEALILQGDLKGASDCLDRLKDSVGCSLWYAEARMLVSAIEGGLAALRKTVQTFQEEAQYNNVRLLLEFVAQRLEPKAHPAAFDQFFNSVIQQHEGKPELAPILAYFRLKVLLFSADPTKSDAFSLWYTGQHSLVDAYDHAVRLLQATAAKGVWNAPPRTRDLLAILRSAIPDQRIANLHQLCEPGAGIVSTKRGTMLFDAVEYYTKGDYPKASEVARAGAAAFPHAFEFHELFAKAAANAGLAEPVKDSSVSTEVLWALYHVVAKTPSTDVALRYLHKVAYMFDCTQFGLQVHAFCTRYRPSPNGMDASRFLAINQCELTPRFGGLYRSRSEVDRFLSACASVGAAPTAVRLFGGLHSVTDIPRERALKHEARQCERDGDLEGAAAKYRALKEIADGRITVLEDAFAGLVLTEYLLGRYTSAADIAVDAYFAQPSLAPALHFEELTARYLEGKAEKGSVSWPIIFYLRHTDRGQLQNAYKVFTALDDFLRKSGRRIPSDILSQTEAPSPPLLFLLRHVCVLEVLDHSYRFESLDALEQERINICQFLMKADPSHSDEYFAEITELSRRSVIRKGIKHIDASKIYVDVSGIRKSLETAIQPTFERFRDHVQLGAHLRRVSMAILDVGQGRAQLVLGDTAQVLCTQMFNELRAKFVSSNEHGLDSYLSIRIRHGTLSGHLRSTFESLNLVTRRNTDGEYRVNEHWAAHLESAPQSVRDGVQKALAAFSAAVDAIIDRVKNEWIQLRENTADAKGMFDFSYDDHQLTQMFITLAKTTSLAEFVTQCIAELTSRTEQILERVRARITDELFAMFLAAMERCQSDVLQAAPDLRGAFRQAVVQCNTELHNALTAMADWFRIVNEREMPDFRFVDLVETVTTMVGRSARSVSLKAEVDVHVEGLCSGKHFAPLFDAIHILVENVVRHSSGSEALVAIRAMIEGESLVVELNSPVPDSPSPESIQEKLNELEQRLTEAGEIPVRTEGGTGFFKLHRIMRHDLELGDSYSVRWWVNDARQFCSRMALPIERVRA